MRKIKAAAIAATISSMFLVATQAQAALGTITADYLGYTGGTASGSVQVAAPPTAATSVDGGGGIFRFNRTASTGAVPPLVSNAAGEFLAICLEFSETLIDPATYDFDNLEAAPINGSHALPMSDTGKTGTRADDLRRLLGHVLPNFAGPVRNLGAAFGLSQTEAKLAVQLAVWEVANENLGSTVTPTYTYGLGTGFLQVTGVGGTNDANIIGQANAWLAALNSSWTPLNNLFAMIGQTVPAQDFVVQVVPIPAAVWLLGSGLIGLFGLARRKRGAA